MEELKLTETQQMIGVQVLREIRARGRFSAGCGS